MRRLALQVGTRGSELALKQTALASDALTIAAAASGIDLDCSPVRIRTTGDKSPDAPFEAIGPKGVFAAELQRALLDGRVDVAVHSLKDLPSFEPEGLCLAAVLPRADARDVLVSREGKILDELPPGTVVGTSSARRRAQLLVARPDVRLAPLRGNVDTRLLKVSRGEVGAAILAGAGLQRLGLEEMVTEWLDPERFVPPPGQGVVVIETTSARLDGDLAWIRAAEHGRTRIAVDAERTFMHLVEGGCDVPLGAWARFDDEGFVCDGFISSPDGSRHLHDRVRGDDASVGKVLAERMLASGADEIAGRAAGHAPGRGTT